MSVRKHLLFHMHLAPGYEWHLKVLDRYRDVFDGERIIAISYGDEENASVGTGIYARGTTKKVRTNRSFGVEESGSIKRNTRAIGKAGEVGPTRLIGSEVGDQIDRLAVEASLPPGLFTKVIWTKNSNRLRETKTFPLLLEECGLDGIAFFCHSKGTGRIRDEAGKTRNDRLMAVRLWTAAMYLLALEPDGVKLVEGLMTGEIGAERANWFEGYRIVGSFRRERSLDLGDGRGENRGHNWHYSGTFWWFDVAVMKSRGWKEALLPHRLSVEALPGLLFSLEESASIYGDERGEAIIGSLKDCGKPTDIHGRGSFYDLIKVKKVFAQMMGEVSYIKSSCVESIFADAGISLSFGAGGAGGGLGGNISKEPPLSKTSPTSTTLNSANSGSIASEEVGL